MNTGSAGYPYAFSAVMYEAIIEYGPAAPRAQYQSCVRLGIGALPQLWSWWPTPVVVLLRPPALYVASTLLCGTVGSQAK